MSLYIYTYDRFAIFAQNDLDFGKYMRKSKIYDFMLKDYMKDMDIFGYISRLYLWVKIPANEVIIAPHIDKWTKKDLGARVEYVRDDLQKLLIALK